MKPNIRMAAIDLDGTLLNSEKRIPPYTLQVLAAAAERGVEIVPVTGRPMEGIPAAVLAIPGLRYAIASNGALIRDVTAGETLRAQHLTPAQCLEVLERSAGIDMVREAFRRGEGYIGRADYELLCARYQGTPMLGYLQSTRNVLEGTIPEFIAGDDTPVDELFFLTDSPERKRELRACLEKMPGIAFADPSAKDLEVLAGGTDKGEAMLWLAGRLGIPAAEIAAFGDGGSDIPMLLAAGIGAAMAGSPEEVLAAADCTAGSCEEDGVARCLAELLGLPETL